MSEAKTNPIEEVAGEKLGVRRWDRPAIFREAADAATDNRLPYWMILILSGAIATLGLALNSSAVVIGAMLVAPLLAPVVGLALALAMGDGRLAIQTGAVVVGSTFAVVLISALLTVTLPFQTITLEISARTRPTTLDMLIAVFSGLVGVVVTVARGSRLSAAIPGVAIAVALIPPLAVAGFGIGSGWNIEIIRGSLLLYGANLAGIVLSGMAVFLLVGMHRPDVLAAARSWHEGEEMHGLAGWVCRAPFMNAIGVFQAPWQRVGLVFGFAIALGFPLSQTLTQIAREARVERAVGEAVEGLFEVADRASVVNRQVVYGSGRTQVYLRVATTEWFGEEDRDEFERRASALAQEPVRLSLEQLPVRGEDVEQLSALLPMPPDRGAVPAAPPGLGELVASASSRLQQAMRQVVLPAGMDVVGMELTTTESGGTVLRVAYAATDPLEPQAAEMLERQLSRTGDLPDTRVRLVFVSTEPRSLSFTASDSVVVREVADLVEGRDRLSIELLVPTGLDGDVGARVVRALEDRGVAVERIRTRRVSAQAPALRIVPVAAPSPEQLEEEGP